MMVSETSNNNINMTNNSYCLLSDGSLYFLPYSNILNDSWINENFPLYSSFLKDKTILSFQHNSTSKFNFEEKNIKNDRILKLLENYKSHAIYLPDNFIPLTNDLNENDQVQIKSLLLKIFPHWGESLPSNIKIAKLTGGITNMLLECSHYNSHSDNIEKVLIRTYGNDTDLIIDRDREFVSHLVLNSLNLAPPIHARFGNGLVYGYIKGRSLKFDELSNTGIYPLIASKLACLHRLTDINTIDTSLNKLKQKYNNKNSLSLNQQNDIWSVLLDWVNKLPNIPAIIDLCEKNIDIVTQRQTQVENKDLKILLTNEINWLKDELGSFSIQVTSHNDMLSGNIIIPSSLNLDSHTSAFIDSAKKFNYNPISFIDYEYMMPAPRAFDIANHFMEWQGFDCDKSKIPQFQYSNGNYENEIVSNWCKYYLDAFHSSNPDSNPYLKEQEKNNCNIDRLSIQNLVNEVASYYGMPGLYWGVWAGIQSEISLIDFDYASYSCERLVEYWNWKREYLANKEK